MIRRGSGASLFHVGQKLRLVEGQRSFEAKITGATFFGAHVETKVPVRGKREHFVSNSEMAKRLRVLAPVPNQEAGSTS